MNPAAVGLALLAAGMHAAWNVAVKGSTDRLLNIWAIMLVATAMALPVLAVVGLPDVSVLPLLAASVAIHVTYDVLLAGAYDRVDLSVAYPIARGASPALVALGGAVWLGDTIPVQGDARAAAGLRRARRALRGQPRYRRSGRRAAGGAHARHLHGRGHRGGAPRGHPPVRRGALPAARRCGDASWCSALRGRGQRALRFLRDSWRRVVVSGLLATSAYVVVLVAVRLAPVGLVSALRETSVVIATLLGMVLLREPVSPRRLLAVATIAAGAALLALT